MEVVAVLDRPRMNLLRVAAIRRVFAKRKRRAK